MAKGGQVLRALSPKRHAPRTQTADSSPLASRQGSRTLFSRHRRQRPKEVLPDLEKSSEEFEREWAISKEEEERRLGEFRCVVEAATGPLRPFYDTYYLRRFLRARSHDVPKAKEMFLKHLQWRMANGIDTVLQDFVFQERDAFLTLYPQGYHKTDKLGRPIYIQHLGQINMKALSELTTEERMIRFHVQEYERALKYIFPACSKVVGRHISQTLTILDLQGVGLRHLTGDVKRIMSLITRVDQDNYPETLGKTLIINAPSIFKMIWSLVKPMLDARTQAKIEVCPSNYMPVLLRWVDAENIPEYLGGKSKGSLLDDVGPWKNSKLVAEIDADIRRRDQSSQQEVDLASSLGSPRGAAELSEQRHEPKDALTSDSEGGEEEFHDVRSRRTSMMSAGSSSYLSADEEYFTPKAAEGAAHSFSSGAAAVARHEQTVKAGSDASSAGLPASQPYQSHRHLSLLRIPDDRDGSWFRAEPSVQQVSAGRTAGLTAAPAATTAEIVSSQQPSVHKLRVATEDLMSSPPLQIPILARVRALEEKIPGVERPIRRYLPAGEAPSKVVGEGTLLSRVAALERAMEALLRAQDSALNEAKRRAEQQQINRSCCACCAVM